MCVRNVFQGVLLLVGIAIVPCITTAQQIVGTDRHTSILCADGTVYGWTSVNTNGMLGFGTEENANIPTRAKVDNISSIFSGDFSIVAVDQAGKVWAWGSNQGGRFGMPSWDFREFAPKLIMHTTGVKKVVVNNSNTAYLMNNGQVRISGDNYAGQYGNGTTTTLDSGSVLVPLDSIVDIFCALSSTCAVRADGTIYAWGNNGTKLIDSSDNIAVSSPVVKLRTNGVISTSGSFGGYSSVRGCMKIVTIEGDVYVWGWNDNNQLGFENVQRIVTPRRLSLPKKVKAVTGGAYHTIVLYEDGTVAAFGDNEKGQLGNPSVTNSATPVNVSGLTDIVAISAGIYTSFAFARDGTLYGWGDNEYHQLNVSGGNTITQPVAIPLPCVPLSITASIKQTELLCAPNPVYDVLRIAIEQNTSSVELYSMLGGIVQFAQPSALDTHITMDISQQPPGMYTVVRTMGNSRTTELIVKL